MGTPNADCAGRLLLCHTRRETKHLPVLQAALQPADRRSLSFILRLHFGAPPRLDSIQRTFLGMGDVLHCRLHLQG